MTTETESLLLLKQISQKLDRIIQLSGQRSPAANRHVNTRQAAEYLHISVSHLYALIYEGKLKPMQRKKHGRILFDVPHLDTYLKNS